MGKRKIFAKTELDVPQVEYSHDKVGNAVILPEAIPPTNTTVEFLRNTYNLRRFDFVRWYGVGIDPITYACQRQIERFLVGQDGAVTDTTVSQYCAGGLRNFLDYCVLRSTAFGRNLTLADVSRELIDCFLAHLACLDVATITQKTIYSQTKPVLLALGRRGLISLTTSGDAATFPRNPFPNISRKSKGEKALSKQERQALTIALRQAIKPIWDENPPVTSELLVLALLIVALHTGRNSTPLLEMGRDCLRPHPKDNTVFLVLWKRRGYNTSKVALRTESNAERLLESTPSVKNNVERLIRRVMELTQSLDAEAPDKLKGRVWLYRTSAGKVTALTTGVLAWRTNQFIAMNGLTDNNGGPLRVNISRLRKTFANRIFELTDGDLTITAAALGNTLPVTDQNYLRPDDNTHRNWQFMGEVLVNELLTRTIGATYKVTPIGRCADSTNGQYAPKREGATCMSFMNCLRCRHYAVTAEDLYKLFSFYFRILAERSCMNKRRWSQNYAHIPRLIDHYIVAEGVRRGIFKTETVEASRELARAQPHPFWSVDLTDNLEIFA